VLPSAAATDSPIADVRTSNSMTFAECKTAATISRGQALVQVAGEH
jgi:hypothetical protein